MQKVKCDHWIGVDLKYDPGLIRNSHNVNPQIMFDYCPKCGKQLIKKE